MPPLFPCPEARRRLNITASITSEFIRPGSCPRIFFFNPAPMTFLPGTSLEEV